MSWKELQDHLLERGMSKQDIAAFRLAAIDLRAQASGRSSRSDHCPEELALSSLVDGTLKPGPRAEMIDHLASCGSCRREVAALSRLSAEPEIRRELEQLRAPEPRTTRRRLIVARYLPTTEWESVALYLENRQFPRPLCHCCAIFCTRPALNRLSRLSFDQPY